MTWLSAILGFLGRVVQPVLLFFGGRASKSASQEKAHADNLERQRDVPKKRARERLRGEEF